MKGLRARLFGSNSEGKANLAMVDAEAEFNTHFDKPTLALVSEYRHKIKNVLGPEGIKIRTQLANSADGDVNSYIKSLEKKYRKVLELENLLSRSSKEYSPVEKLELMKGHDKWREQNGGRRRTRSKTRKRNSRRKKKSKTKRRKRLSSKRRAR